MTADNPYDKRYDSDEYYWGRKPSEICSEVLEYFRIRPVERAKLIDLGCGEGRNAVHFARHGFEVHGLDSSLKGLEKTRRLAQENKVEVTTFHGDIAGFMLRDEYDVIFSTGALHYLQPAARAKRFEHFREHTCPAGLNVMSVFVEKPFVERAPDAEETAALFRSGELFTFYWDWELLHVSEEIFDCMSGGVLHRHSVNRMIARRPDKGE